MPADTALNPPASTRGSDFMVVGLATLATLAVYAFGGFASLADPNGDNDALMRLVQVRDLIAGQSWFDPTQYRMGSDGGFEMHWSRLVDAPIALLVLAGTVATGGQAMGEAIASVLWPHILYAAALFLILRAARRYGGEKALLPALVIGGITLHVSGLFSPGSLDHHTPQLVLTLALVNFLLAEAEDRIAAFGAGAAAALMLAIGMETLPYVATGGICVAALFLLHGEAEAGRAGRFGVAFGAVSLCIFVLTVPQTAWLAAQCDAFSVAQTSLAAAAGAGLWGVVRLAGANATVFRRAAWLAALGLIVGGATVAAFPQCLGDPFAGLDPRLRTYWLDGILEAQSVVDLVAEDPTEFASYYATPVLGLILLCTGMWRAGIRRRDIVAGGFLASAVLVSFWQVRGSIFSLPLAVIPLAGWIAGWRVQAENMPSPGRSVKLLLAWLLSFNLVWHTAANAAATLVRPAPAVDPGGAELEKSCYRVADYALLATLPPGTVLAISNLGASILAHTGHRALSGSYHRNVAGNLMTLDMLMGPVGEARELAAAAGVDFVAFCPGNNESENLAKWSPGGLEAALRGQKLPDWLSPVPGSKSSSLRIFRVRP